jgi:P2X purinoceptor 7
MPPPFSEWAHRVGLSYYTKREVKIKSATLGGLYYLLSLVLAIYVIAVSIVIEHGYQAIGPAIGTSDVKVKGQAYTLAADGSVAAVYDSTDLVRVEAGGVFLPTALMVTQQYRGTCADTSVPCNATLPCAALAASANGLQTGNCSASSFCEIQGWCPPEAKTDAYQVLHGVGDWTLYIRLYARFPLQNDLAWNNVDGRGDSPTSGWNLWTLSQLLSDAGVSLNSTQGADVVLSVEVQCDLDRRDPGDRSKALCEPRASSAVQLLSKDNVYRLDSASSSLSVGANRRYTGAETLSGAVGNRTLVKAAGVRVQVLLSGTGARFNLVETLVHLGAGLGLWSIVYAVIDVLLVYVLPKRALYCRLKYDVVDAHEAEREEREAAEAQLAGAAEGEDGWEEEEAPAGARLRVPLLQQEAGKL